VKVTAAPPGVRNRLPRRVVYPEPVEGLLAITGNFSIILISIVYRLTTIKILD